MNLKPTVKLIKELIKDLKSTNPFLTAAIKYSSDDRKVEIDLDDLTLEEVEAFRVVCERYKKTNKHAKDLEFYIRQYQTLRKDPTGRTVGKLLDVPIAVKGFMKDLPNKWVFMENKDDNCALPWFVEDVEYHPPYKRIPAYVTIELKAFKRGKVVSRNVHLHRSDMGRKIDEILLLQGLYMEDPAAVEEHQKQVTQFKLTINNLGALYMAGGVAYSFNEDRDSWRGPTMLQMIRDGRQTKVIIDDNPENDSDKAERSTKSEDDTADMAFWTSAEERQELKNSEDDDIGREEVVVSPPSIPLHPYVRCFDMDKHLFVETHISNLTEYKYDPTLIEKLVLPSETKSLISILMEGSQFQLEDVIQGKMPGIIVIATGEPGTGKTLTAEVFSEVIERPLYVVQCSQLGIDVDTVEKRLRVVMRRAQRWNALLLLDEADVYIHERGDDMEQNAVIGIFLRVLEYYRGVLFMTSNRGDIIDDAIMSRATAWIKYVRPETTDEVRQLFQILSEQFQVKFKSAKVIEAMIGEYPRLSGREIRNVLKLVRLLSLKEKKPVDEAMLLHAASFQDLSGAGQRPALEVLSKERAAK